MDVTDMFPEYFDCVWRRCSGIVLACYPPIEPFRCQRCGDERGASNYGNGYRFEPRICPSFEVV